MECTKLQALTKIEIAIQEVKSLKVDVKSLEIIIYSLKLTVAEKRNRPALKEGSSEVNRLL